MSNPDKAQKPDQDVQELQDEDLDQASGGWAALATGVDSDLQGKPLEVGRREFG